MALNSAAWLYLVKLYGADYEICVRSEHLRATKGVIVDFSAKVIKMEMDLTAKQSEVTYSSFGSDYAIDDIWLIIL